MYQYKMTKLKLKSKETITFTEQLIYQNINISESMNGNDHYHK